VLLRAQVGADAADDPAEQLASSSAQGNAAAQPEAEHLALAPVEVPTEVREDRAYIAGLGGSFNGRV